MIINCKFYLKDIENSNIVKSFNECEETLIFLKVLHRKLYFNNYY